MRVIVVGDTHGNIESIKKEISLWTGIDLIVHTGDHYRDGVALGRQFKIGYKVVTGNCDRDGKGQLERFKLGKHRVLLTHGHLQNVKRTMNNLYYRAQSSQVDLVLFGHTHVPFLEKVEGIWFMNPGSPSYPRAGYPASYGIIEVEGDQMVPRIIQIK